MRLIMKVMSSPRIITLKSSFLSDAAHGAIRKEVTLELLNTKASERDEPVNMSCVKHIIY